MKNQSIGSKRIMANVPFTEFHSAQQIIFPKNTIVVHQGEVMQQMYYIKKGIVRGYYLDEKGKEVTKCFSREEEIFGVEGFLYDRAASYSIECLEEVICIKFTYNEVRSWMVRKQENTIIVNKMIIDALCIMEERAKLLLLSDAKERYERFIEDYAEIAGRLSQKYIASYLGINEASLSRLKRKLT